MLSVEKRTFRYNFLCISESADVVYSSNLRNTKVILCKVLHFTQQQEAVFDKPTGDFEISASARRKTLKLTRVIPKQEKPLHSYICSLRHVHFYGDNFACGGDIKKQNKTEKESCLFRDMYVGLVLCVLLEEIVQLACLFSAVDTRMSKRISSLFVTV